jgi:TPR repeat protein
LRTRASAGDAKAAYDLGEHYADGAGVKRDFQQAMSWFAKAAGKGQASAQWKLGLGYLKGIGVPQDDAKAAAWFLRAANQAHIGAQIALSELYFDGRGMPQDYIRAYTWATIAAQTTSGGNEYLKAMAAQMTPDQVDDAKHRVRAWWEHRVKPLP